MKAFVHGFTDDNFTSKVFQYLHLMLFWINCRSVDLIKALDPREDAIQKNMVKKMKRNGHNYAKDHERGLHFDGIIETFVFLKKPCFF